MKIGIVCYPTFGGSGVVATELGKALAREGHKIHFITYRQPTRLDFFSENLFYHEVDIKSYPLFDHVPYELALASKMVNVVKYEKLDLLHVHYAIPHASAAYMAKQILKTHNIQIPVVTTLHGTDITLVGKDPSYEPVVTFSINASDGVTAVSQDQTDNVYGALRPMISEGPLSELIPKTGEEFTRLPNGGRIDTVTSNARSRLGQRVTFVAQDETGLYTPTSGMIKVAETQRRGAAGMGGRTEETTNAWNPAEDSTAQRTAESKRPDIFRLHRRRTAGPSK